MANRFIIEETSCREDVAGLEQKLIFSVNVDSPNGEDGSLYLTNIIP